MRKARARRAWSDPAAPPQCTPSAARHSAAQPSPVQPSAAQCSSVPPQCSPVHPRVASQFAQSAPSLIAHPPKEAAPGHPALTAPIAARPASPPRAPRTPLPLEQYGCQSKPALEFPPQAPPRCVASVVFVTFCNAGTQPPRPGKGAWANRASCLRLGQQHVRLIDIEDPLHVTFVMHQPFPLPSALQTRQALLRGFARLHSASEQNSSATAMLNGKREQCVSSDKSLDTYEYEEVRAGPLPHIQSCAPSLRSVRSNVPVRYDGDLLQHKTQFGRRPSDYRYRLPLAAAAC
jgi:hypothetical protein